MAGETDFGTAFNEARIGNPLLYTRRVFLCVISSFFAQDHLLTYPNSPENPYKLICDESGGIAKNSKIFISDRFSGENAARRPEVVVGRGAVSWNDMVIGDHGQGVGSANNYMTHKPKVDRLFVPIEISVYSQNDLEADNIAWSVAFCVKAFEREIKMGSLLFKIESTTIGPVELDKASGEAEQFVVRMQTGANIGLRWLKSTTLTNEEIQQGFCKISGDPYPKSIKDLCIFAEPVDAPEHWT